MGLFSSLFGKEESSKTESVPTLTPDQTAASSQLLKFLQGSGDPSSVEGFSGDLVAPLSNLETLSLSALEDRSRAIATTGDPNIRAASEALMGILNRGEADAEDFIETNINQPLQEQFEEARAGTGARFADQFFGSARREQDATNFDDFISTLARTQSSARLGLREQDTNAVLKAIGLAPGIAGAESDELLNLLDAGSVPRETESQRLQGEFLKFQQAQGQQTDLAHIINQFLGTSGRENITTVKGGTSGLLGGFLGGAAPEVGRAVGRKAAAKIF